MQLTPHDQWHVSSGWQRGQGRAQEPNPEQARASPPKPTKHDTSSTSATPSPGCFPPLSLAGCALPFCCTCFPRAGGRCSSLPGSSPSLSSAGTCCFLGFSHLAFSSEKPLNCGKERMMLASEPSLRTEGGMPAASAAAAAWRRLGAAADGACPEACLRPVTRLQTVCSPFWQPKKALGPQLSCGFSETHERPSRGCRGHTRRALPRIPLAPSRCRRLLALRHAPRSQRRRLENVSGHCCICLQAQYCGLYIVVMAFIRACPEHAPRCHRRRPPLRRCKRHPWHPPLRYPPCTKLQADSGGAHHRLLFPLHTDHALFGSLRASRCNSGLALSPAPSRLATKLHTRLHSFCKVTIDLSCWPHAQAVKVRLYVQRTIHTQHWLPTCGTGRWKNAAIYEWQLSRVPLMQGPCRAR